MLAVCAMEKWPMLSNIDRESDLNFNFEGNYD